MTETAPTTRPQNQRRPIAAAAAIATVALTLGLGAALLQVRHDWSDLQPLVRSHETRVERPRETIHLDPRLVATAQKLIPRDGVYAIVTGPHIAASDRTKLGVTQQLPFWLLPRRLTAVPAQARWVISFGGALGAGARYLRVVHVGDGMDIAERRS